MINESVGQKISTRSLFGVFPIDLNGNVGELVGMWHRTLPEAEQHLKRITDHQGEHYVVLSNTEHDKRVQQQHSAGVVFKTGHDLLMDKFDQWLKENGLVRGTALAAKLGFSEKDFKAFIKKNELKSKSMPGHANLIGYPSDFTLSSTQQSQYVNERGLNAQQVAKELGLIPKEFTEVRRRSDMAHSDAVLGRTIPNDS